MIVDILSSVTPTPDAYARSGIAFTRLDGYIEHFTGEPLGDRSEEDFAAIERAKCPDRLEFMRLLDEADISKAVLFTENYDTTVGISPSSNRELAEYIAVAPDRFLGLGGADPWQEGAAAAVDEAIGELELDGVLLSPFKHNLAASDDRLGPIYARCEALGVPVFVHTGIHWKRSQPIDLDHPRHLDLVAGAFPDLKIVAVHAGWPWLAEMMIVAWRHPNIFIDISAHRPRHLAMPLGGGDALIHYGNRMLADRILFGSTFSLLNCTIKELADEVRALPLKPAVIDKWLGLNAARLFDL
jgi:predicted TIM-barrel fold metal-dependent hydrolase